MSSESRQIEQTAAALLARRDAGEWSNRDESALQAWLAKSPAHRVAFLRMEAAWKETARLKTLAAGSTHARVPPRGEWARSPYFATPIGHAPAVARRSAPRSRARRWPTVAAMAASLLVVAGIAGGLLWWRNAGHVEYGSWQTAVGGRQVVHLTDGSTATLASDSDLHAAFARHERNLDLVRGEAFFEVAHDRKRPFVVHANGYRVIAVGTRFDVRRSDDGVRVVVMRGVVRLQSSRDSAASTTDLPAGSIALVNHDNLVVRHVPLAEVAQYLSWRDGYVVFHDTPLADAIQEFNRYNNHKITIADPALDELRVGGNFRLDNSAAFVRLMQEVFPVRAEERGDTVLLSRRNIRAHGPD